MWKAREEGVKRVAGKDGSEVWGGQRERCLSKIKKLVSANWWGKGGGLNADVVYEEKSSQKNKPFHILSNSRSEKDRWEVR